MNQHIEQKPVFDKKDLMERLDNDFVLAAELAELFVEDVREKIVSIQAAIDLKAGLEIEKAAHALKGAASNLSAEKVRHLAFLIETAGKNNDMKAAEAGNKMLLPAVEELIDVLHSQLLAPGR